MRGVYLSPADFYFGAIMGGGGRCATPEQEEKHFKI